MTRYVASFTPATESSSTISWTQPPSTVGHLYYRVTVTTPSGPCDLVTNIGELSMTFALNGDTGGMNWFNKYLHPGVTTDPGVGGYEFSYPLLPDDYEFTTENYTSPTWVADCAGIVAKTELFVETVASA
ncbi:MAG TPA: hypothetical protein VHM29_06470 [Acidimicrobiia bacterium]|nr:hypothetical protein [Acidimicrobiia bacterium]